MWEGPWFTDTYRYDSINGTPPTQNPPNNPGAKVYYILQKYWFGSTVGGEGCLLSTHDANMYQGQARHY